jgi:hypothetical protein
VVLVAANECHLAQRRDFFHGALEGRRIKRLVGVRAYCTRQSAIPDRTYAVRKRSVNVHEFFQTALGLRTKSNHAAWAETMEEIGLI